MNVDITSTCDLRKTQKTLRRRYQAHKVDTATVHVTRAGSLYRARLGGQDASAFGETKQQAAQRLRHFVEIFKQVCTPKACDVAADRAEERANRTETRDARSAVKFNPRRYRTA